MQFLAVFLILSATLFVLLSSSVHAWNRERQLPPYDYVQDGDLLQDCISLIAGETPEAEGALCINYMQGFIDAMLANRNSETKPCLPSNFKMEDFIKGYLEKDRKYKATSLYDKWEPAQGYVEKWAREYFNCEQAESKNK
jgi:hypothetical protein